MKFSTAQLVALALTLVCLGCSSAPDSGPGGRDAASLYPIYGSSFDGVSYQFDADSIQVSFDAVPASGRFVRLDLPAELAAAGDTWTSDSHVLRLLVPTPSGADIGVVALPGYAGEQVSLQIGLTKGSKQVSNPPFGDSNLITDLAVSDAGAGQVNLHWTQINTGDYDFNGEVNIADITPLAQHLGNVVDRSAVGANQTTEYWLDGDGNGEVNLADLTPIGYYYTCYINGYNIKQNGTPLPGAGGQPPTVARSQATVHTGLPSTYDIQVPGSTGDSWLVAPVDQQGTEGADSGGGLGPADLVANLTNISGIDLFTLIGGGSGPFGPGKFSSRVIDPIDVVTRAPIGNAVTVGTQTRVSALPRGKTILVDFRYAPIVDLATGAPKGAASTRGAAALRSTSEDIPENEQVISSIPITMPASGSVSVTTDIAISPNPAGGYFVDLSATIVYPGDDPQTVPVETSYERIYHKRLAYASSAVATDSNDNGEYEDEAELNDSDRDCISDSELEAIERENEGGAKSEREVECILDGISLAEGTLHIRECVPIVGGDFPADVVVKFTGETEFLLRHRTDANPDGEPFEILDPHELEGTHVPPLEMEVELYDITPDVGDKTYWAEKVRLVIDERT